MEGLEHCYSKTEKQNEEWNTRTGQEMLYYLRKKLDIRNKKASLESGRFRRRRVPFRNTVES